MPYSSGNWITGKFLRYGLPDSIRPEEYLFAETERGPLSEIEKGRIALYLFPLQRSRNMYEDIELHCTMDWMGTWMRFK